MNPTANNPNSARSNFLPLIKGEESPVCESIFSCFSFNDMFMARTISRKWKNLIDTHKLYSSVRNEDKIYFIFHNSRYFDAYVFIPKPQSIYWRINFYHEFRFTHVIKDEDPPEAKKSKMKKCLTKLSNIYWEIAQDTRTSPVSKSRNIPIQQHCLTCTVIETCTVM